MWQKPDIKPLKLVTFASNLFQIQSLALSTSQSISISRNRESIFLAAVLDGIATNAGMRWAEEWRQDDARAGPGGGVAAHEEWFNA